MILKNFVSSLGENETLEVFSVKSYQVFYWIKKNKKECLNHMLVHAANSREACKKCKEEVYKQTGRNAFRPTTKAPTEEMQMYRKVHSIVVD